MDIQETPDTPAQPPKTCGQSVEKLSYLRISKVSNGFIVKLDWYGRSDEEFVFITKEAALSFIWDTL